MMGMSGTYVTHWRYYARKWRAVTHSSWSVTATRDRAAQMSGPVTRPSRSTSQSCALINSIIARVAAELCIPVLDVYALDAAAGFYWQDGAPPDFHPPAIASLQAALAVLLATVGRASCALNPRPKRPKYNRE